MRHRLIEKYLGEIMKNNVLIGMMVLVWLVLMADIIWKGTEGRWTVEDAEKIGQLEVAQYTNQIMVVAVSDEDAKLCLYEKKFTNGQLWRKMTPDVEDEVQKQDVGKWQLVLETEAIIGKNGLGKTKEGDEKTPVGVFLFTKAFGVLENPGTKIPYTQIDEKFYWVDDSNSKYYNQFVSIEEVVSDWESAEHLVEYDECYGYVLATSYNSEGIPGKGSAVFLHCTSEEGKATAGCVAIPEKYMQEIMKHVESQCVLIIDKAENILNY